MSNNNAQAILYVPSEDKFNEIDKLGINEDLIVSNNGNNDAIITNLELEDMKHETTEQLGDSDVVEFKCKRKVMKRCMKSHRLHVIIVILVILDSLCVSVELIIDLIITVYNQNSMDASLNNLTNNAISPIDKKNSTTHVSTSERFVWSFIKNMNLNYLSILISIETFFKYFGLMILSIFVIEITCKIIFIPRELVRSKWGIFDAIVVFTSFVLDVILLKDKKILHTVSGLITLFRLWRITRIINGIVMTMEKKSAKKIEKLLKLIEKLKTENEQLKNVINEKNLIIENLQKSNKT